ncbi:hypothetical protein Lesp02_57110 [Lentzea sp. NBRC 105346]|uniref:maleylpyruvate isomerase N-terminal domain-containing protein n=1 Tax=Lentzea sp. NBRC 105346 TaxID=3032205 RepID=UPI0024A21468|nr:maleylpyruvate isomerase N-terminal domain-containing protein [Lentzea sp. NBRC 105346]GLZ33523.1 hypothetical protein Lesp02_57110 [Lentzea sp. NBRC 105346]
MDWVRLRQEITETASRVGASLRALPPDTPLARVTWTAAETGAHLVSLPGRYLAMADEPHPFPASLAEENQRELAGTRDPAELATLLEAEVGKLLAAFIDGDRPVWYYTARLDEYAVTASMLSELLLHGTDLARALGRPWTITRQQAVASLRAVMPAAVLVADPRMAPKARGTYHVHERGGDDWTVVVRDEVTVSRGKPARADLHLSVDPVGFLLNAVGLMSRARFALTGGMVMWGRKPWLAAPFSGLFARV